MNPINQQLVGCGPISDRPAVIPYLTIQELLSAWAAMDLKGDQMGEMDS